MRNVPCLSKIGKYSSTSHRPYKFDFFFNSDLNLASVSVTQSKIILVVLLLTLRRLQYTYSLDRFHSHNFITIHNNNKNYLGDRLYFHYDGFYF